MSDDLEITHGGAIAVDPDALRPVADAMVVLAPKFSDAASALQRAHRYLMNLPTAPTRVDIVALRASVARAEALHEECATAGENTRLMADVYELVERRTELAGLAIQDGARADRLHDRIAELEASDPRMLEMEAWLLAGWKKKRFEGLDEQLDLAASWAGPGGGVDLGVFFAMATMIGATGAGRLRPHATLSGSGGPVSVTPAKTGTPLYPPSGLGEAMRRLPDAPGAQLKVEKYTMPNGTHRFVLYSKGTQPSSIVDPKEPFDMQSNLELYAGQESASYVATVKALEASGAKPGDEVHVYAHSQGAMNAAYLSTQSEFDVSVQLTAGSPLHSTVGKDQLLIELRHTDDVVSSLAGGGSPGGSGSPDSIVVTRDGDPLDLGVPAHLDRSYTKTADMADASGDVRLEAWREKTRELGDAVSIESTEYVAKRE